MDSRLRGDDAAESPSSLRHPAGDYGKAQRPLLALLNALDLDIGIGIVLRPASVPPHAAKVRILEECAWRTRLGNMDLRRR